MILGFVIASFIFPQNIFPTGGENIRKVFANIKSGIENNEIAEFSGYFDFRIYINLTNGTTGYYSSNQVYYILEEYFRNHQPVNLDYSRIEEASESPYAAGSLIYLYNGEKKTAKVFISLKLDGGNCKIVQITID
ncbi:MAG: DUF4783 domain-containing protein [bacterium]